MNIAKLLLSKEIERKTFKILKMFKTKAKADGLKGTSTKKKERKTSLIRKQKPQNHLHEPLWILYVLWYYKLEAGAPRKRQTKENYLDKCMAKNFWVWLWIFCKRIIILHISNWNRYFSSTFPRFAWNFIASPISLWIIIKSCLVMIYFSNKTFLVLCMNAVSLSVCYLQRFKKTIMRH